MVCEAGWATGVNGGLKEMKFTDETKRAESMSSNRGYKIRHYTNGKSKDGTQYKNYALTVPNEIAEAVPEGLTFVPRMTDDGLLYEPVHQAKTKLPAWAQANHGSPAAPKKAPAKRAEKASAAG
jgi:hypothetical protein